MNREVQVRNSVRGSGEIPRAYSASRSRRTSCLRDGLSHKDEIRGSRANLRLFVILLLACSPTSSAICQSSEWQGVQSTAKSGRVVTVADSVTMSQVLNPSGEATPSAATDVSLFSPDGGKVVVLTKRGNLEANTNDYSILVWRTDKLFNSAKPEILLTLSSTSYRAAIEGISWLPDSETLLFLGEHPGELRQLYSLNIRSHRLKRITNHLTRLFGYSATADGKNIAYTAEAPSKGFFDQEETRRNGVVVSAQSLPDLLLDRNNIANGFFFKGELFVKRENAPTQQVRLPNGLTITPSSGWPILSPDGETHCDGGTTRPSAGRLGSLYRIFAAFVTVLLRLRDYRLVDSAQCGSVELSEGCILNCVMVAR